jgi:hypothetical protein
MTHDVGMQLRLLASVLGQLTPEPAALVPSVLALRFGTASTEPFLAKQSEVSYSFHQPRQREDCLQGPWSGRPEDD